MAGPRLSAVNGDSNGTTIYIHDTERRVNLILSCRALRLECFIIASILIGTDLTLKL